MQLKLFSLSCIAKVIIYGSPSSVKPLCRKYIFAATLKLS